MTSLVLAAHDNRSLSDVTAQTVTAALALGEAVDILVAGENCAGVAAAAARLTGVAAVRLCDDARYAHPRAEPIAALLLSLVGDYETVLAPATSAAKAILPRLAALIDVPQISEITKVLAPNRFERPIYAGSIMATVQAPPGKKVLTVRPTAFAAAGSDGTAPVIRVPVAADPAVSEFLGETHSDQTDLTTAKIVVAGGRGVGPAQFALLRRIAGRLQAGVGASRAAVDAGLIGNDAQIGQTGKVVAPRLYLAVGISGAIQHVSGIRQAEIIVAINRDASAPIFQIADFGLVADLTDALTEIDAELARRGYN